MLGQFSYTTSGELELTYSKEIKALRINKSQLRMQIQPKKQKKERKEENNSNRR
jgi:hypothetical protein